MNPPLTIPLSLKDRDLAQRFKNQQPNSQKADQVYYQTLAILAVNYYCQWLEIETDLDSDDSWNPIIKLLSNSDHLTLKNIGKIECLPILPGDNRVQVPPEALADRIGYIVVQLSDDFRQGNLLGFVASVASEEVKIEELRSL